MIRLSLAAVAAAGLAVSPALAQFPGQATVSGLQASQPTDFALSCEQILAEANPLNLVVTAQNQAAAAKAAEAQAAAAKTANSRRIMGGLAGGALAGAAQFGMMRGALNNPMGRQAVLAATQGANNMASGASAPAVAPAVAGAPSIEQQRMTVLLGLYQAKKCG